MHDIYLTAKADADGVLRLNIPVEAGEYFVTVSLRPKPTNVDERGWPIGYFEATFGSIDDEAFKRYPQGEYEQRETFE